MDFTAKDVAFLPDGVYFDSVNGFGGIDWPVGTAIMPVGNVTDALDIAAARKLRIIYVLGTLTLDRDMVDGIAFIGFGYLNSMALVDINGHVVGISHFENLGIQDGPGSGIFSTCSFKDCNLVNGNYDGIWAKSCLISGTIALGVADIVLHDCFCEPIGGVCVFDFSAGVGGILAYGLSGGAELLNMVNPSNSVIYGRDGLVLTLDGSCTAGAVEINGDVAVIDGSAGTTVVDNSITPVRRVSDTFSYDETNAAEQEVFELIISEARKAVGSIWLDMANVTQNTTVRAYHMIDKINYRLFWTLAWTAADPDGVQIAGFTARGDIRVTLQCGGGGVGNVDVPYAVV